MEKSAAAGSAWMMMGGLLGAAGRRARYVHDLAKLAAADRGRRAIRALFLSDGRSVLSEAQFEPFRAHRHRLRDELGLVFLEQTATAERPPSPSRLAGFDLVVLKFHYKTPPEDVLSFARSVSRNKPRTARLAYFDGNDEISIQWPGLLEICDVYWKKQVAADPLDAVRSYEGSTNLTHFVARRGTADVPLRLTDSSLLRKIVCAPSIALNDNIARQKNLLDDESIVRRPRTIDAVLRADVPDNWMGELRRPALQALQALADEFNVICPTERVSAARYIEEMQSAKICVSPFGYGEICYRDYEAALHGCLLFKPDMSHVRSEPDVFRPFETYVPLQWDYSDLGEKVARYAGDQAERERIVGNARRVLREALQPGWFVAKVEGLLKAAGCR